MKAITVKQPWASLIIHWGKDIENRSWPLPRFMRGQRVAIHSSAKLDKDEFASAMELIYSAGLPNFDNQPMDMPLGSIIGTVEIVDCVTQSQSPWFCGEYGFVLKDPIPCEPIKIRGALGFWDVPEGVRL